MGSLHVFKPNRIIVGIILLLICCLIVCFTVSYMHARDAQRLCDAIQYDDMETLEILLDCGTYVNSANHTPMYFPIGVITEGDYSTPLLTACEKGNYEAAKLLLVHGADPNRKITLGFSSIGAVYATPQGRAARFELVPLLLNYGAAVDNTGHGRLMNHAAFLEINFATEETAEDSIALIAQMVDDPANLTNRLGMSLLAACDSLQVARWLIQNGANVSLADNSGNTPLMRAVMRGNKEMVVCLLHNGADKDLTNIDGKKAYDLAMDRGYSEIAELIQG